MARLAIYAIKMAYKAPVVHNVLIQNMSTLLEIFIVEHMSVALSVVMAIILCSMPS